MLPLSVVGNGNAQTDFLSSGLTDAILDKLSSTLPRLEISGRRIGYAHVVNTAASAKKAGSGAQDPVCTDGGIVGVARRCAGFALALRRRGRHSCVDHSYLYDSVGAGQIVRVASSEIAARIAGSLTPQETQLLERLPTQNRLAYEWSLKGDAAADGSAYDRAADAFRRAIQLDRGFHDAYAKLALADASLLDDGVEKSEGGAVLLEKLIAVARDVGDAYTAVSCSTVPRTTTAPPARRCSRGRRAGASSPRCSRSRRSAPRARVRAAAPAAQSAPDSDPRSPTRQIASSTIRSASERSGSVPCASYASMSISPIAASASRAAW